MEHKNLIPLRMMQLLKENTDCDHPLNQQQIIELLDQKYGIRCERKAIGRNTSYLKEAGYDIESCSSGIYIDSRTFERSELKLLIDSVLSSKHIDNKHSEDLIKKLIKEGGRYFTSGIKYLYYNKQSTKTANKSVFYNIELIDEAIEKKQKIKFVYNKYDTTKKLVPKSEQAYIVNPYHMLIHNQRYYLICNIDKYDDIRYLRLDRITNIEIINEYSKPLKTLGYPNGLDLASLYTTLPYMFGEKASMVTMRCRQSIIGDIIDWFGTNFSIKVLDSEYIEVGLQVGLAAMKFWLMQYGDSAEVLSPISLCEAVASSVKYMNSVYNTTQGNE